jgi:hypothetical protein
MGLAIELMYPSQVKILNTKGGTQVEQSAVIMFIAKNGVQQNRNVPMITPRVMAAFWSEGR